MNFNQLQGFAYDKESQAIGAVAGVDFIKQTITIQTDEDALVVAKLSNVEYLENIGEIGGTGIINHDVVTTVDGKLYEIVLQEGGHFIQMHLLDKKLQRVEAGELIGLNELDDLSPYVVLVGNIYELEVEEAIDFNIRVVREIRNGEVTYFYACNNAEKEEIDLIKVVFVGHHILEEEKYTRTTFTHEEYLEEVEVGAIKEVSPNELMNYVTGLTYGKEPQSIGVEDLYEIEEEYDVEGEDSGEPCDCPDCLAERNDLYDEEEEEDYCNDCGRVEEDCTCDW